MQFFRRGSPYIEFLTPRKSSKEPEVITIQKGCGYEGGIALGEGRVLPAGEEYMALSLE